MDALSSFFYWNPQKSFLHCTNAQKAWVYYKNRKLDLISLTEHSISTQELSLYLDQINLNHYQEKPRVFYFFYEFHHLLDLDLNEVNDDEILLIEIIYSKVGFCEFNHPSHSFASWQLSQKPTFDLYKEKYEAGLKHLIKGNCYQFNLTFPFDYKYVGKEFPDAVEILNALWKNKKTIAPYAHALFVPQLKKLWASNSPEMLCETYLKKNNRLIRSMPIKGTYKIHKDRKLFDEWLKLQSSRKDQAELFMIADLVRNDLARALGPKVKVVKDKAPLLVPGLIHQYSHIEVEGQDELSLYKLVHSLFPGGSVTGAPKKSSLKILKQLEEYKRSLYCGSTLLWWKNHLWGSINIRTAVVDMNTRSLRYCAGGGVTLLSNAQDEYEEMLAKTNSFMALFD